MPEVDLARDPGGARNLAADRRARVAELRKAFDAWRGEMKPQVIPDDHPVYGRYKRGGLGEHRTPNIEHPTPNVEPGTRNPGRETLI